jgi:hypothetical protein
MKKMIITCIILAFSATAFVNAQTITTGQIQTKQEKQTVIPGDKAKPVADQKTSEATQTQEQQVNPDGTVNSERLGEHGPYLNDPDFAAKKAEWIKNYPEEYKNNQKQKTKTNPTK